MVRSSRYAIALTAALGMVMAVLDNTIINIALVPIANGLRVDLSVVQWLITGYFLSQAAVIPIAGYLSNRFGRKNVFLVSIILFTLGSLLCGLARDATLLITFRIIQGIGAGAIFPVAQAITLEPFPPNERAKANAIIGIPILLAPVFGPILGGWLNDLAGWPYLFFINVPIGILSVLLIWFIIPRDRPQQVSDQKYFDYIGLTLSILGVLALVYAFTLVNQIDPASRTTLNPMGHAYGWSYWLVWTLFALGALLLTLFTFYELRSRDPVLDVRLFKEYNFTIASVVSWFLGMTVFGSLLLIPIFLQQVHLPHLTAFEAGLVLFPQGIGAVLGIALGGPLYPRIGVRALTAGGVLILIVALWQFGHLTPTVSGLSLVPWNVLLGFGLGLTIIPSQTLALQTLSGTALAKGSSLYAVTRQITSSIGTAIITSLLVQQTISHMAALQSQLPVGTPPDPRSPQVTQMMAQAGTSANNDVFTILAIATGVLFFVALLLPGRKKLAEINAAQTQENQEAIAPL